MTKNLSNQFVHLLINLLPFYNILNFIKHHCKQKQKTQSRVSSAQKTTSKKTTSRVAHLLIKLTTILNHANFHLAAV